mgnify:CR=1 FL=1
MRHLKSMLIPHDSPLRTLPESLDRRSVLFLDGIRYAIQIFDLASSRLGGTLHQLSQIKENSPELADGISSAIADAWTMIDSTHRLRELLEQLPGLKKKEPALQLFLKRTSKVEDLRNFFQHFRNEIDTFTELGLPLWGTLSWVYTDRETGRSQQYSIAPGTFFDGVGIHSCTYDRFHHKFVERVLFQAGTERIDLADLNDWMTDFVEWYSEWFRVRFDGTERYISDVRFKISFHAKEGTTS